MAHTEPGQYQWIPKSRGDKLPDHAVYAGTNGPDGPMYVAKVDNIPSKVNLNGQNIHNFWGPDNWTSSGSGEVLTTIDKVNWQEISKGQTLPNNTILGGNDKNGRQMWIAKSHSGEPGKLMVKSSSLGSVMDFLKCNHDGVLQRGSILTITKHPNLETENQNMERPVESKEPRAPRGHRGPKGTDGPGGYAGHQGTDESEASETTERPEVSEEPPKPERPKWKHFINRKIKSTIKNTQLDIKIGKLARDIYKIIAGINGDIISLEQLIDLFTVNLSFSDEEAETSQVELIVHHPDNYIIDGDPDVLQDPKNKSSVITRPKKYPIYIIFVFNLSKQSRQRSIGSLFSFSRNKLSLEIKYTILEPANDPAQEICEKLIDQKTKHNIAKIVSGMSKNKYSSVKSIKLLQ